MGNDMCFWGPNGMISKFLASVPTTVSELRALVARQVAAFLRLRRSRWERGTYERVARGCVWHMADAGGYITMVE